MLVEISENDIQENFLELCDSYEKRIAQLQIFFRAILFQIQPLCHKMISQYKGPDPQYQGQYKGKCHIEPKISGIIQAGIVIPHSKEKAVYTHIPKGANT